MELHPTQKVTAYLEHTFFKDKESGELQVIYRRNPQR